MLLGGRYELLRVIASGGMATVHLARAVGVGGFERLVAIKVMHPHIASEPEFVSMFLDEARLAAQIRHPNVVPTIDVQEAPEGLFLVMEFVDGPSLKRLRKREGNDWRLPHGILLRVLVDALNGLHAAHELCGEDGEPLKLIHRDVSPANVLIGLDGVSRITDFGVARAETRLSSTRGGQLKGKIPYMPPEQLMSQPLDRRCDVYAAGVVLWEELTGRRLFKAESEGALLQRILDGPSHTPAQVEGAVPAAIDQVCMRALAKDPNSRFSTAADMAEALENAALEAGIRVASTRAVAAFVESSGVHERLDAKRVAAIKRASNPNIDMRSSSHPPAGTGGTSPSGSSGVSGIVGVEEPVRVSLPSAPSQVTAGAQTLNTGQLAAMQPQKSSRLAIMVGATIAVLGLVAGYWVATSTPGNATAPAAGETAQREAGESKSEPAPAADPAPVGSTEPVPSAASAQPGEQPSATASSPMPTAPVRRFPGQTRQPPKTSPQPPSGAYNPERL